MQNILSQIVLRLQALQKPNLYQLFIDSYEILRVYLIGICNDKPANILVQNQSEPNGLYGCSKCEIAGYDLLFYLNKPPKLLKLLSLTDVLFLGYTTPAKIHPTPATSKKITTRYFRIFPTLKNKQPQMRSNSRWRAIAHALQNGHVFFTEDNKTHSFGYAGEAKFADLAFIDHGTSFMSDTLHTIYHGAFVCATDFKKIFSHILFSEIEEIITIMDKIIKQAAMVNSALSSIDKS